MDRILLFPPLAFVLALGGGLLISALAKPFAPRPVRREGDGKLKPYACGEDVGGRQAAPEYTQFFPFAFFFTIMHVIALIVATVPGGDTSISALSVLYLLGAAMGLFILFRS